MEFKDQKIAGIADTGIKENWTPTKQLLTLDPLNQLTPETDAIRLVNETSVKIVVNIKLEVRANHKLKSSLFLNNVGRIT